MSIALKLVRDECEKFQTSPLLISTNNALKEWENHFQNLFTRTIRLDLKYDKENINEINIDDISGNLITKRIEDVRNRFLKEISEIEELLVIKKKKEVRQKAVKIYEEHSNKLKKRELEPATNKRIHLYADVLAARRISITVPLRDLVDKLRIKGFFHPKKSMPTSIVAQQLSDSEVILMYSSIMRGIMNYYQCVDNLSGVKSIVEHVRKSCILTLCRKHKKKTN